MTRALKGGLSEAADLFDGYILDLWGVLHNGQRAFPDTVPTLQAMKNAGKKIWLLSNAPRRSAIVQETLRGMGIADDLYDGILTSGEATYEFLKNSAPGRKYFFIGKPDRDSSLYDGLDLQQVANVDDADFLLVSGPRDFSHQAEEYRDVLMQGVARGIPFVCANPDRVVHVGDDLVVCAGTLVDIYEAAGGKAIWFGKPYPSVYETILARIGVARVLAVGDSMVTDIAGAAGAGIASALVTSGIHREEDVENRLQAFLGAYQAVPDYLLGRFSWN